MFLPPLCETPAVNANGLPTSRRCISDRLNATSPGGLSTQDMGRSMKPGKQTWIWLLSLLLLGAMATAGAVDSDELAEIIRRKALTRT